MGDVKASEIAGFLEAEMEGDDFVVAHVSSLSSPIEHSVVFAKKVVDDVFALKKVLVLGTLKQTSLASSVALIRVANPRLAFAKVVARFFVEHKVASIHPTAVIGAHCDIHPSVSIGAYCVIGDHVVIGEGSVINNHVTIHDRTTIGQRCYIKSGAVIGEDGFGFDFEPDGTPIRVPHMGRVDIGNDVEIGANTSIARATLGATLIEDFVKMDDLVMVAHNCRVGKNTVITACAELSGSVNVGSGVWIGPNASVIQKTSIGDGAKVGIGAVVNQDVSPGAKVMGLEAIKLKALLLFKKMTGYG